MTISIITAVYNRAGSISKTIKSVLSQTYKNIEYIIVDGNSTDGTQEIIASFGSEVTKFISEKDSGIYEALNKGISMATGQIIGVLHADDVFAEKDIIETIAAAFKNESDLEALFGDVAFVNPKNPERIIRYYSSQNFKLSLFKKGFMPAHPSFFCKRSLFRTFGSYRTDMTIAADFELLVRLLFKARVVYRYFPLCTTIMTTGGASTAGIKSKLQINREFLKALKTHGIRSSYVILYARYFSKWRQYTKVKQSLNNNARKYFF